MKRTVLLPLVLICLSVACRQAQSQPDGSKRAQLIGEWRNVSLKVMMETVNGTDSSSVFLVTEDNWVEKLGIQPIRTRFKADSTYISKYYAPNDSLMLKRVGRWWMQNDRLIMEEDVPEDTRFVSVVTIDSGYAHFRMMMDWDEDGQKDDRYYGVQRKHSNGP